MSSIRELLNEYRVSAKTEREKGTYFERLAVAFIKHDPGMAQEYEDAWLFSEWAAAQGLEARDTGIDAVAKVRGEDGYCAIQCKFYREGDKIQKSDIDSFFTASGKKQFSRRIIIDTTDAPWSPNAEAALSDQDKPVSRIGLDRLESSPIDWFAFARGDEIRIAPGKVVRKHQQEALEAVRAGFNVADRGKLIMACGTGKTFTALKIAEDLAGPNKRVLFLVPSLALMSQTIREWTIDAAVPLRAFAVCSDAQVGKRRKSSSDVAEVEVHDLDYPATTNPAKLAEKVTRPAPGRMTAVFATYQSIQVISDAQKKHGLPDFELIICDEAHRTTGATLEGEDESNFVKVHKQEFIASKKRLYMTATPRVFGDAVKSKANEASAVLCSMDDESLYGKDLFARGFGWAVENKLLTDYKVLVLAVDEQMVSGGVQKRLADGTSELKLDDATKIIGCYKALTKHGLKNDLLTDPHPMRRAVAFCKDIATSKLVKEEFAAVVSEYLESDEGKDTEGETQPLTCQIDHVDGTFGAKARTRLLDWLKEEHSDNACRILTNARCLSEGVDVPALDAILFMHPRKSQIDVVQSVGRVMRRAPGKNLGYVILPVGVPVGMTPEQALNDNERYRVVWQILNALRSHDERFDAMINKADLGADISSHIEVIAVSNHLPLAKDKSTPKSNIGHGSAAETEPVETPADPRKPGGSQIQLNFAFDEFSKAIMAKIVKKCGRRDYWEDWAADIAKIAQTHISRITALVAKGGTSERRAFEAFLAEIRDDLNNTITEVEAIEMLAQHLITRPVFDALFEGYSFAQNNPVSRAMQNVLEELHEHRFDKEADSLSKFYDSVKRRAAGVHKAEAKQKIILELYDKFFRNAFPKMTDRLGIVYTPVEVVDFVIHSVNEILKQEFGKTLGSKNVHILDPFTGTGTFITRLLQSGAITRDDLSHKFRHEIHANEIVLLAYYIAAINIEAAYQDITGASNYEPFDGIVLTDTFQLFEQDRDMVANLLPDNSKRRTAQRNREITVVVGNPPYSAGQTSANDNAANIEYPNLDRRIEQTYAQASQGTNKNPLYDSYIRAFRWASDRIGTEGVIGFVTNASWLEGMVMDGVRSHFHSEFSKVYVFHLRGNQRTSGELSRKEGGKIFGSGSRSPIAITILVKDRRKKGPAEIFFYDVGDYLDRDEKLAALKHFKSIEGVAAQAKWLRLTPDKHNDWLNHGAAEYEAFALLGSKKDGNAVFRVFSSGLITNRDVWCYNYSKQQLEANISSAIAFYNHHLVTVHDLLAKNPSAKISDLIERNAQKFSWDQRTLESFEKNRPLIFSEGRIVRSLYRPFTKTWVYRAKALNWSEYQMGKIFPGENDTPNLAIMLSGSGSLKGFTALMSDTFLDRNILAAGVQCFPLYVYERNDVGDGLFSARQGDAQYLRSDGISDIGLDRFASAYPGKSVTKEDVFYYIYGLLHSAEFRDRFSNDLCKDIPRVPILKNFGAFAAFVTAGRELSELHINFEHVEPYPVTFKEGDLRLATISDSKRFFRVEVSRFGGKRPHLDRTTVIYNSNITITGIPLEAYEYVVNGKPALEWVMERQCVKTDKDSGIVNDANRYAIETMGDPAYPLKLFQRVITVSLETMKIVRSLPPLGDLSTTGSV